MSTTEGPTPAGGAYAIAVFMDDHGRAVDKEQATRVGVTEYTAEGERIQETWAYLCPEPPQNPAGTPPVPAVDEHGSQAPQEPS